MDRELIALHKTMMICIRKAVDAEAVFVVLVLAKVEAIAEYIVYKQTIKNLLDNKSFRRGRTIFVKDHGLKV